MFLLGVALPALAQTTPMGVKLINQVVEKKGETVTVNVEFVLDKVEVRSNDMIIYTPVIVSAHNSADRLSLPPVMVTGNKRNKIVKRQLRLNGQGALVTEPLVIVKRKRRSAQLIEYSTTISYSSWMEGATLSLETEVSGCASCYKRAADLVVVKNIIAKKEFPTFALAYIEPEVEAVKARSDRHTATFNFKVNKFELLRDYKDNQLKLDDVDRIIREVAGNKDFEITEFTIAGYASPDGSAALNKILAKNRANAFASYLVSKYNMSNNKFRVESFGADWAGLVNAVEASSIADKEKIVRIINTVGNPFDRPGHLMKLSNGNTYRILLDEFYPPLRRTEYTIAYVVRPFDLEEAREIIKTNPKLLSLNEMYMVAQSYGKDTPQFKEVFDIAVRMYPSSEIAILNSAAADIENREFDRAIARMQKLGNNHRALNNMGVAFALKGDLQKAIQLFSEAAASNESHALDNLAKLKSYIVDK